MEGDGEADESPLGDINDALDDDDDAVVDCDALLLRLPSPVSQLALGDGEAVSDSVDETLGDAPPLADAEADMLALAAGDADADEDDVAVVVAVADVLTIV